MSFLDDAIRSYHEGERRVSACHANRASSAGIECKRRLLWARTRWQDASLVDPGLQAIFNLGRALEPVIVRWLEDAGIEVEQRQRDMTWPAFQITGHIDGLVRMPDGHRAVLEIKTASKFSFEKVRKAHNAAELLEDRRSYVRGYVVQAALYAFLLGLPKAFLLFVCKDTGASHTVEIDLEDPEVLGAAEAVLRRFEAVNAAVAAGQDLPAEPSDACKSCPFLGACAPARDFGPGVLLLQDDEVTGLLARREELADAAHEYAEVDEALKERFSASGEWLSDDWHVVVKESLTTRYEVPKDVKAQYATKVPQLRRSYERVQAKAEEKAA